MAVGKLRYPCSFHRLRTRGSHRAYDLVADLVASDIDAQVSRRLIERRANVWAAKRLWLKGGSIRTSDMNRRGCISDKRALVSEMLA